MLEWCSVQVREEGPVHTQEVRTDAGRLGRCGGSMWGSEVRREGMKMVGVIKSERVIS